MIVTVQNSNSFTQEVIQYQEEILRVRLTANEKLSIFSQLLGLLFYAKGRKCNKITTSNEVLHDYFVVRPLRHPDRLMIL